MEFVANFLRSEPALGEIDLKLQCCHRALGLRPPRDVPPRSFVLNFLENKTKDQVISTAWEKKYFHLMTHESTLTMTTRQK